MKQAEQFKVLRARLRELGFSSYAEYLRSPHWVAFRLWWFRIKGNPPCSGCHQRKALELHHRNYTRIGCERKADVTGLCRQCHGKTHTFCFDNPKANFHVAHRISRTSSIQSQTLQPRSLGRDRRLLTEQGARDHDNQHRMSGAESNTPTTVAVVT